MTLSRYRELSPPPSLRERVVCLWTQDIGTAPGGRYAHPILPDGCADVVWIGDSPVVAGPASRCIVASLPARTSVVGVRFRPGWAASSLGLPVDELRNQHVPLAEIWSHDVDRLAERIGAHAAATARLRALTAALEPRLARAPRPDAITQMAVSWLIRHPAGRIRDLGRAVGLSERQLQRRFHAAVGYGPKTFQRVMRLQRLLSRAAGIAPARLDLAGLACDVGYADQAHMCREVRTLAGRSPGELLLTGGERDSVMSDLFKTRDASGA